jgi:hypothetical protein
MGGQAFDKQQFQTIVLILLNEAGNVNPCTARQEAESRRRRYGDSRGRKPNTAQGAASRYRCKVHPPPFPYRPC